MGLLFFYFKGFTVANMAKKIMIVSTSVQIKLVGFTGCESILTQPASLLSHETSKDVSILKQTGSKVTTDTD